MRITEKKKLVFKAMIEALNMANPWLTANMDSRFINEDGTIRKEEATTAFVAEAPNVAAKIVRSFFDFMSVSEDEALSKIVGAILAQNMANPWLTANMDSRFINEDETIRKEEAPDVSLKRVVGYERRPW